MKAFCALVVLCLASPPAFAQPPDALPGAVSDPVSATALEDVVPDFLDLLDAVGPDAFLIEAVSLPIVYQLQPEQGVLSLEELSDLRGGETIVFQNTTQSLNATNTGNSVVGDTIGSGAVTLSPNAFTGFDGIGNFVVNTGHNNNLQGSISVTIAMTPQ